MKKLTVLAGLALAVALGLASWAGAQEAAPLPKGHQLFLDMKCNMCHAVSTVGIEAKTKSDKMKGPDLVNLEDDKAKVTQFVKREIEIDGAQHKKEFKGTDEELQALVDWLLEQKAE